MSFLTKLLTAIINYFYPPKPKPVPPEPPNNDTRLYLLTQHNAIRSTPLILNEALNNAAQKHANWMNLHKQLTHDGNGTPSSRIIAEGYRASTWGENIALCEGAAKAMSLWLNSPGHKQNMVNVKFKEAGFGNAGKYWCAVFATPR